MSFFERINPERLSSEDKMREILERRAAAAAGQIAAEPSQEGSGSATAAALAWSKPFRCIDGTWITKSVCARFQIHATRRSRTEPWTYESLVCTPRWNNVLAFAQSKDEAIQACELRARFDAAPSADREPPSSQTPRGSGGSS